MSELIPFDGGQLPAHLRNDSAADVNSALSQGVSAGFPVMSIKGKTFTIVQGDTRNIITKPDDEDEPASNIQVIILDANPNLSKNYYESEYEEGSTASPDCFSEDGKFPSAEVEAPQAKSCATCPHNAWGSGKAGRGKACQDSRRLAIAPSDNPEEPMLLRVPPASLKGLREFGTTLGKRGVSFDAVVTKLRFDPEQSSPVLIFKPVGFLDAATYEKVQEIKGDDTVQQITGIIATDAGAERAAEATAKREAAEGDAPEPAAAPEPEPEKPAATEKPKRKRRTKAQIAADKAAEEAKRLAEEAAKAAAAAAADAEDDDEDDDDVDESGSGDTDDLDDLLSGFDD